MGEALFDLERILLSKQPKQEKMTAEEVNVLSSCKSKALKDFTIGAAVGSGLVWAATWKLSRFIRVNIAGGAAAACGLWTFGKSLDSCVDHILGLDGTRMQTELANIIAQKYRNDTIKMKLISKHFYSEEVFDASTTDRPNIRLHHRNVFSDNLSLSGRTSDTDGSDDYSDQSPREKDPSSNVHQHKSLRVPSLKNNSVGLNETRSEVKKSPVNSAGVFPEILEDPLAFMFGTSTTTREIHHQTASSTNSSSSTIRSHSRRSHRRRRHRHHELEEDRLD